MLLLPVLPVIAPIVAAAVLAAVGARAPRALSEAVALSAAVLATGASLALLAAARTSPVVYWFGGWTPRAGVCLGVDFAVDAAGAGLASLAGLLSLAALAFAIPTHAAAHRARLQVLLLVFLAALSGFGLTGDLFNLFVFFELMSASAYVLTGFESRERGPIQGALAFGVTNTVGAVLVLLGVGLVYGRTGALNLAQIGRALGDRPAPPVIAAFALITAGFSVKAALVPFHFWLADAHAAAPTAASVLFSGVMVEAGLYAVVRLWGATFQGPLGAREGVVRGVLVGFGLVTVLVGGVMCAAQRHLKRLLAFSTVSHMGALAVAAAMFDPRALGGVFVYALGHGFAKGALFLCSGAVLHRLESVDELALCGRGGRMRFVGLLFAVSGLALAGAPPFGLFAGEALAHAGAERRGYGWASAAFTVAGVLTGGAVLRAAGRIFLGLGPVGRDETGAGGETTAACETPGPHARLPLVMKLAPAVLLGLSLAAGAVPAVRRAALGAAAALLDTAGYAAWVLDGRAPVPSAIPDGAPGSGAFLRGALTAAAAAALGAAMLFPDALPRALRAPVRGLLGAVRRLRALQDGHVGGYVAWLVAGAAVLGALLVLGR